MLARVHILLNGSPDRRSKDKLDAYIAALRAHKAELQDLVPSTEQRAEENPQKRSSQLVG